MRSLAGTVSSEKPVFILKRHLRKQKLFSFKRTRSLGSGSHIVTRIICTRVFSHKVTLLSKNVSRMRGHSGKRCCLSKGSLGLYKQYFFFKNLNTITYLCVNLGYVFIPVFTKMYSLVISFDGSIGYIPVTSKTFFFLLQACCLYLKRFFPVYKLSIKDKITPLCDQLYAIPMDIAICHIPLYFGGSSKLVRACGSYSLILKKYFKQESQCPIILIRLPSFSIKFLNSLLCVMFGAAQPIKKFLLKNTHGGFHRRLGKKPSVRGIVKNPVDHPHGGRERTVLWPRNPWGKSTK